MLTPIAVFVGLVGATAALDATENKRYIAEERNELLATVSTLAGRLQAVLAARVALSHGLEALVHMNEGIVGEDEFHMVAEHLRGGFGDVRSLQLAPHGIVTMVHPVETNRAAIGHDIRNDPARAAAVEHAIRDREFVIAGPVELLQGGTAIIARRPIFVAERGRPGDRFWGFSTVILDLLPLLEVGGVTAHEGNLRLSMRGRDGFGAEGAVFFGDAAVFDADPVTAEISLPGGSWQIAAAPQRTWGSAKTSAFIWATGLLLATLAAALLHYLLTAPLRLQEAVEHATTEAERSRQRAEELSEHATRASEDKTRFLAAASHDLQQPLAALRLFVGLLAEEHLGDRARSLLPKMETTLQGALDLLDSLLHSAALETGKVQPRITPVALRDLMRHVVGAHQQAAETKGLKLSLGHCQRTDCRGLTMSDPVLLKRILGNLVSNAVRYSETGEVRMRCACRNDRTLVFVSDTGPGIPAEKLPRMFDEFARGERNAGDGKGIGLGLAIVAKLAGALGHRVAVRSREGFGTAFMLLLQHRGLDKVVDKHVLVVEDDPEQLFAMQFIFEDLGFSVTPATSLAEALDQVAYMGQPPDIVVTDYWLGDGGTGTELLRRLSSQWGEVPAIVLTSDIESASRDRNGWQLLKKPCSARELRQTVLQLV